MEKNEDEIPDYLKEIQAPSEDDLWKSITDRFEELLEVLRSVHLETKERAIPQRYGSGTVDRGVYWDDPEIGARTRSWLQVAFDPDRDVGVFEMARETALALAGKLGPKIAGREVSVEALDLWGAFREYAAMVEHEYLRNRADLRRFKGGEKHSLHEHKIWFSHLFMRLRKEGDNRLTTENRVLDRLHEIEEEEALQDPTFPKEWIREFFGSTGEDLAASFKQNKFPIKEMRLLAEEPLDGLPPLEW